jgi:prolipoprotein diacylglyceryltransferase
MTSTGLRLLESLNAVMDRVPRTELRTGGWRVPAYGLGVATGVISSVVLVEGLAVADGLAVSTATATLAGALLTAVALALVTRAVTGEERFTYFHYAIVVVLSVGLMLSAAGQPVLPYLDLIALGLGTCLTAGRLGCLMAGCCHGRPSGCGVRYGRAHVNQGFSPHLVGVRLFPLQAVEAVVIGLITALGVGMILDGARPGSALAWLAVAYSAARFSLELLRGDGVRPYLLGVSEAQWTAVLLAGGIVWAERTSILPLVEWHAVAAAFLGLLLLALASSYRRVPFGPWRAGEILELAAVLEHLGSTSGPSRSSDIAVHAAGGGIRISAGSAVDGSMAVRHYSVSGGGRRLSARGARRMARLISHLDRWTGKTDVVRGAGGVFHVVMPGAETRAAGA